MRLKSFIEQTGGIFGEKAEIEVLFDSQGDTPNVSIDGKLLSSGRYPDAEELRESYNVFLRRKAHEKIT